MPKVPSKDLPEREARRLLHARLRGKNHWALLNDARQWLSPSMYGEALEWIGKQQKGKLPEAILRIPRSPSALMRLGPFRRISLTREIRWAGAFLLHEAKLLSAYSKARSEIGRHVLKGEFDDAAAELAELQVSVGFSYWGITLALALAQLGDGIEGQKRLAAELRAGIAADRVPSWVIHHLSVRNEPSVTPSRYAAQLREEISQFDITPDWRASLRYWVVGPWPTTIDDAGHVLWHCSAASFVDYYEAFLHLAQVAVVVGDAPATKAMRSVLPRLESEVPDARLAQLHLAFADAHAVRGGSAQSAQALQRAGPPQDASAFLEAARSKPLDAPATFGDAITSHLHVLLNGGPAAEVGASELERYALNLPVVEALSVLDSIAKIELGPVPPGAVEGAGGATLAQLRLSDARMRFTTAVCRDSGVPLGRYISDRRTVEISFGRAESGAQAPGIFVSGQGGPGSDPALERLMRAEKCLRERRYEEALTESAQLATTTDPYVRRAGIRIHTYAQLLLHRFGDCARTVASVVAREETSWQVLPLVDLADGLRPGVRRALRGELAPAIVFHSYVQHIDGVYEAAMRSTAVAVLRHAGVERPTQLRAQSSHFDRAELSYFLRRVCVPEVFHAAGVYESSRELQQERIGVLEWASELDPAHASECQVEIVERTRRIVLNARRTKIEHSKIQLDLDGYLRDAEKAVGENYDRYLAYREAGVLVAPDEVPRKSTMPAAAHDAPLLPATPQTDNAQALFAEVVRQMRSAFIGTRYHGLDGSLSTRIRHGVLESELRSALITPHLVTQLDEVTGAYQVNEYWTSALSQKDPHLAAAVDASLAEFSRQFDLLIQEIKEEWIQFRRLDRPTGMIDLSLDYAQISQLEEIVARLGGAAAPFGLVATTVFQLLAQRIEPTLAGLRERISDEGKRRAVSLLRHLEARLEEMGAREAAPELSNAVREVEGALQRSFDRVAAWLTVSYEAGGEPLPLPDVVDIAIEMARHFDHRFLATSETSTVNDVMVPGPWVVGYTDILLTLFDNVLKRAALEEQPSVRIAISSEGNCLRVEVRNPLGEAADRAEIARRTSSSLDAIRDDSYLEADTVRGTGLWRVHHILRTAYGVDPCIEAGLIGDAEFRVAFNIPRTVSHASPDR